MDLTDLHTTMPTLLDSGSSHNFIDTSFIHELDFSTHTIPPVKLRLLNGSVASIISESISLPTIFPSGEKFLIDYYVTTLDSSCKAVLGYSFLSRYNPLIDWVKGNIIFQNTNQVESPQMFPFPKPTISVLDSPEVLQSHTSPTSSPRP